LVPAARSVSEYIQHVSIETPEDATHEVQRFIRHEIKPVNYATIYIRRKKPGTIDV
jgi:hypothetical protein